MLTFIINIYKKYFPYKLRSFIYGLRTLIKKKSTFFIVNENGFCDDGLATNHVCDFMHDEEFMRSYNEGTKKNELETHPTEVYYRAYILTYFAQHCISLEGDFVELGAGKGIMSKIIVENSNFGKIEKKLFLFDTFEGVPKKLGNLKEAKNIKELNKLQYNYDYYEFVKEKFSMYSNVELIKGILPESIKKISLKKISFLHIDLNNAYSEIESIKILYDKLVIGACVILDDYCYDELFREQKNAWDDFIKTKNKKILSLPTGQCFFIKD